MPGPSDLVGLVHVGSKMVQEVVIVAALRTPIGCFNGALAPLHAHEVLETAQPAYLFVPPPVFFAETISQRIFTINF